jgi:hypothetical protein
MYALMNDVAMFHAALRVALGQEGRRGCKENTFAPHFDKPRNPADVMLDFDSK